MSDYEYVGGSLTSFWRKKRPPKDDDPVATFFAYVFLIFLALAAFKGCTG